MSKDGVKGIVTGHGIYNHDGVLMQPGDEISLTETQFNYLAVKGKVKSPEEFSPKHDLPEDNSVNENTDLTVNPDQSGAENKAASTEEPKKAGKPKKS